ncbi:MAG: ribosome recycling factor [Candidatus Kapaibacterium sp.]
MPVNQVIKNCRSQMDKSVDFTKQQLGKIRTGRASASLVDSVTVDYYGSPAPLSQTASISVPDARTIMIQPFDRNLINDIEKAIRQADLGFNPQNDGTVIRVPVPPLTEERRKEFVKVAKKYAEEGKVSVRSVRRDHMEELKKLEKNKDISEDDRKRGEDEVQKETDIHVSQIEDIAQKKEKELMED